MMCYGFRSSGRPPASAGFSYGRLLHSKGSELGGSRPSSGLEDMSTLDEAMKGPTSKQ